MTTTYALGTLRFVDNNDNSFFDSKSDLIHDAKGAVLKTDSEPVTAFMRKSGLCTLEGLKLAELSKIFRGPYPEARINLMRSEYLYKNPTNKNWCPNLGPNNTPSKKPSESSGKILSDYIGLKFMEPMIGPCHCMDIMKEIWFKDVPAKIKP